MNTIFKTLSIIALLGLGTAVRAQDATTDPAATDPAATETPAVETPAAETAAPAETTPAEPAEPQIGDAYVKGQNGDWLERCIKTEDGTDPCQMYQLLMDADGNPVAEIAILPLPAGSAAVAGVSIVAPLETLLAEPMTLTIDSGTPKRYGYTVCSARPLSPLLSSGCLARVGLTAEELAQFKRGNVARLTLVPAADPAAKVEVAISLSGFTAAYDALSAN